MQSILDFIRRFHFAILFLILETFAIILSINSNERRYAIAMNSSNRITSAVYTGVFQMKEYLDLRYQNKKLLEENARLKNSLLSAKRLDTAGYHVVHDTVLLQQYTYLSGKVIKNSILKKNNYITINKGSKHGVEQDMAVVSPVGVVGIITNVSKNNSVALSILNSKIGISAKIKKNNYYGSVVWEGRDYRQVKLEGIPNHTKIAIGDTIVTSGYSAIFPEGILIGKITDFEKNNQDNFYTIHVLLSENFKKTKNVYLIKNLLRKEQLQLQDETQNKIEQ